MPSSKTAQSYAITICRSGPHDDYYYNNPERMTGDKPPQPYLDLGREEIIQRVISADALKLAFDSFDVRPEPNFESIHGAFGKVENWFSENRERVKEYLKSSKDISNLVEHMCAYTPHQEVSKKKVIESFIRNELIQKIDSIVDDTNFIQQELSQRLATGGILPLFGFPTQVRQLFEFRSNEAKLENQVISDRSLDHAIWSFSPGSEVPKDKKIHHKR